MVFAAQMLLVEASAARALLLCQPWLRQPLPAQDLCPEDKALVTTPCVDRRCSALRSPHVPGEDRLLADMCDLATSNAPGSRLYFLQARAPRRLRSVRREDGGAAQSCSLAGAPCDGGWRGNSGLQATEAADDGVLCAGENCRPSPDLDAEAVPEYDARAERVRRR